MWNRLDINMHTNTITKSTIPPEQRLGGRALIAHIIAHAVPPNANPLGPENILVVCNGMLAGTPATTSGRLSVGTKSPLTGHIKESNAGGLAGKALASLGIKCLVISGQSSQKNLQVLLLQQNRAELISAEDIQGLKTCETTKILRQRFGKHAAIICAGPAGEQLAPTASLQVTDLDGSPARSCGRGGTGAVLASKGLKAIVVIENIKYKAKFHDRAAFMQAAKKFAQSITNPQFKGKNLSQLTHHELVLATQKAGFIPWQQGQTLPPADMEHVQNEKTTSGTAQKSMHHACQPGCLIGCGYKTSNTGGNDNSSADDGSKMTRVWSKIGLSNSEHVRILGKACNDAGVDAFETGDVLALALKTGHLNYRDLHGALRLVEAISAGTPLGKDLGMGAFAFAKKYGLEHSPTQQKLGPNPLLLKAASPLSTNAEIATDYMVPDAHHNPTAMFPEKVVALMDSTGLCLFACLAFADSHAMECLASMLNALDNSDWTVDGLIKMGDDCLKNEQKFNHGSSENGYPLTSTLSRNNHPA